MRNIKIILVWTILLSSSIYSQIATKESVTKLYVATFNRAPDAAGLNYWIYQSGLSLEDIAKSFFDQPETKSLYPSNYSEHQFVKAVYENLFNREPDNRGWSYWENELKNNPNINRSVFILAVVNGALDDDAIILSNKEKVGEYFANQGLNDPQKAKDIMRGIDASTESVQHAINIINSWVEVDDGDTSNWNRYEKDALTYLNEIRVSLGMPKFSAEPHLYQAAKSHSIYQITNNSFGHYETSGYPNYTGDSPMDRVIAAGYPVFIADEDISSATLSNNISQESIDGLFTAIYHRFGFLDFTKDEIGIGEYQDSNNYAYTYDMGNKKLREFCERGISDSIDTEYYMTPCKNQNIKLSIEKYRSYLNRSNKKYVYYPANEIKLGIFTTEVPYPIPGYSFSGNPVSISFNDNIVDCSSMTMNSFSLIDITTNKNMDIAVTLDQDSDPNHYFHSCDFAIFPKEREEFGHTYKAVFNYDDNYGNHSIEWKFSIKLPTKQIDHILKANRDYNEFTINRGEDYYIYVPPTQEQPRITQYYYTSTNPELEVQNLYDGNTFHIKVSPSSPTGYIDMYLENTEVYLNVN